MPGGEQNLAVSTVSRLIRDRLRAILLSPRSEGQAMDTSKLEEGSVVVLILVLNGL